MFEALEALDLSRPDFVVAGSAPLLVHDLRSTIHDLDIIARGPAWEKAKQHRRVEQAPYDGVSVVQHSHKGLSIEVLDGWFPVTLGWDVAHLIEKSEKIRGINFLPLDLTLTWKTALNRDKDLADIRRLRDHLYKSHDDNARD
jgi:hypothetical protein